MSRLWILGLVLLVALGATAFAMAKPAGNAQGDNSAARVVMQDDCDPADPAWNEVGGCHQKKGDVSLAEFVGENDSPLALSVIGHQAWRNDPSYLKIKAGRDIHVTNAGGRPHTFTEVANFGGGVVPPLNEGLTLAPECPGLVEIAPGDSAKLEGLAVGNHRFMCCFHPWMRALVKVK